MGDELKLWKALTKLGRRRDGWPDWGEEFEGGPRFFQISRTQKTESVDSTAVWRISTCGPTNENPGLTFFWVNGDAR